MNGSLLVNTATYLCDEFNLGMTLHCESNANISSFILLQLMIKQNNYLQPKEIIMCYINFGKLKNSPMLSVRISSYGCTREVWRARKMRKSSSRRSREQL